MLKKPLAFIKKDLLMEFSYKLSFFFMIFSIFLSILTYFFIDKLFGHRIVTHLEEFGVNYFSYVLLSTAFFSYVGVGLGSFSRRIRSEQMLGTLEAILLTPTRVPTILISLTLWNLLFATLNVIIYIVFGVFLFKINFSNINLLSTLVILLLTITSFSSLGILSASFIMVFKRGNPVGWIFNGTGGIIGGVFFPVTILPGWLQFLAKFYPITYAVRAIELAVYRGADLTQLSKDIGFLFLFSCILLPLSFVSFKYALKKARRNGSLLQY
jgi:ABC-2 type transport system permease protein